MRELPKLEIVARPYGDGIIITVVGPVTTFFGNRNGELEELVTIVHDKRLVGVAPDKHDWETRINWPSWGTCGPAFAETFARALTIAQTIATHLMSAAAVGGDTRAIAVAVILSTYGPESDR